MGRVGRGAEADSRGIPSNPLGHARGLTRAVAAERSDVGTAAEGEHPRLRAAEQVGIDTARSQYEAHGCARDEA